MAIHPGFAPLLQAMKPMIDLDWATVPIAELRAMADVPMHQGPPLEMARVEHLSVTADDHTIPARLYVPANADAKPALTVFFHGGGWVIGTLETHDATCRELAQEARCAVLSVDYRLAPESRYPVAVEDCFAATRWAADNAVALGLSGERLAVAGDSAGGNLAAAVALMARDRGGPELAHQLLIYPVTDHDFATSSYKSNSGPDAFLTEGAMRRFWADYLGDIPPTDAPLARLLGRQDLAGLPPATIVVAEHDPLRDEGVAYAEKLRDAGVAVDLIEAPGMIHGFFGMTQIVPDATEWTRAAASRLRGALA